MTVVAIWAEGESFLFAVADTRVGIPTDTGHIVRTDRASKLLPLSVVCRKLVPNSLDRPLLSWTTYGFAFAGDTLPALMTYSAGNACLGNLLMVKGDERPPSLASVAEYIRKLGEHYFAECWSNQMGAGGKFDAAVFGWCARTNFHRIFRICPRVTDRKPRMTVEEVSASNEIVAFGSGADILIERVAKFSKEGDEFGRKMRTPKIALESMLRDNVDLSVGGSLQLGLARAGSFELIQYCHPPVPGQPKATMEFLGFDLFHDLGFIDGYVPGMNGLA